MNLGEVLVYDAISDLRIWYRVKYEDGTYWFIYGYYIEDCWQGDFKIPLRYALEIVSGKFLLDQEVQ